MSRNPLLLALSLLFAAAGPAFADVDSEQTDEHAWPTDFTRRPLTLRAGMLELGAGIFKSEGDDPMRMPTTLMLDARYGVTDATTARIRVGELTAAYGARAGLCMGDSAGCMSHVGRIGADVSYHLTSALDGEVDIALDVGAATASFDPLATRGHFGGRARYNGGAGGWSVTFDPRVEIGMSERGVANPDAIVMPVRGHLPLGKVFDDWLGIVYTYPITGGVERVMFVDAGASVVPVAFTRNLDIGLHARFGLGDASGEFEYGLFVRVRP
ncbi:MAG TPA: hypothetical protein VK427_20195 [Kofleriaceae bacterium]|nr:hypothetical protein [Kofleriaceae bacterium]